MKTIKATEITDFQIGSMHCDNIIASAKEIRALLNYKDNGMIELNKERLKADIDDIKNSISEIELLLDEKGSK